MMVIAETRSARLQLPSTVPTQNGSRSRYKSHLVPLRGLHSQVMEHEQRPKQVYSRAARRCMSYSPSSHSMYACVARHCWSEPFDCLKVFDKFAMTRAGEDASTTYNFFLENIVLSATVMVRILQCRGVVIFARGTRKRDIVLPAFRVQGSNRQGEHGPHPFGSRKLVILISIPLFLL
ncbi:uncharacterized protein M421DRAFT_171771 [Didymella exigua CBS 183.55]|uniref:Uncharacterized protein n=1 Tax=Didymella exigua CBS 183.55 TaxID=1150837 RepID=A0A6A5RII3_9PLEO|nr:uncharacterized protein M421DRAFT_171771 [Didymella exigua CBS 183.55]KAF1927632.1 hypothetical protein M421DRAFT_171771 [Didymella exigua CBS 183.55]